MDAASLTGPHSGPGFQLWPLSSVSFTAKHPRGRQSPHFPNRGPTGHQAWCPHRGAASTEQIQTSAHAPDVGSGGPPAPHGSSSGTAPGAGDLTGDIACGRGRCWRGFWSLLPPQDPPTHDLLSEPSPQLHHGTWGTLRGCENHFLLGGRGNVTKGFLRDTHCSWRALGAPACTNLSPLG